MFVTDTLTSDVCLPTYTSTDCTPSSAIEKGLVHRQTSSVTRHKCKVYTGQTRCGIKKEGRMGGREGGREGGGREGGREGGRGE